MYFTDSSTPRTWHGSCHDRRCATGCVYHCFCIDLYVRREDTGDRNCAKENKYMRKFFKSKE